MAYNPKTWKDDEIGQTPIKASDLNHIEQGIANAVEKNSEALVTNVVSRNLFNKNEEIVSNANIDANGTISSNNNTFYQAKYILVEPNTKYTVSSANNVIYRIAEYDNSKTFIKRTYNLSSSTKYTIVTSSTTKFIRLAIDNSVNIDTVMFAEDDDTNYTSYLNLQELQENNIDTGWLSFASYGGYRKIGKLVTIRNYSNGLSITLPVNGTVKLGDLPTGFIPVTVVEIPIAVVLTGGAYNMQCVLRINNTTRAVEIVNRGSSSITAYGFRIFYTFPID